MMAAVQPFLSGAISKTVNLPNEATVDDIKRLYEEAWRLGIKAVAVYRDGCKASQPLSASSGAKASDDQAPSSVEPPIVVRDPNVRTPGVRVRLPKKRSGFTQEARVGGHKIFLRTGEYADASLGEIFVDMHKEGAAFRSLMNCFSMSVSIGLQYGVPLETFVDQFTFTRFEPQGMVEGHPNIKFATSIVDYLFRVLGIEYLKRYELAHVPPADIPQHKIEDPTEHRSNDPRSIPPPPHMPDEPIEGLASGRIQTEGVSNPLSQHLEEMMGDAPVCDNCGHITVRNGACYKCLNCGNSIGCS
jgi:ribonucleoside-diphosphate reductase alpha chain